MRYRVLYMGTPAYAVPTLQALAQMPEIEIVGIVTQPDQPQGRKLQLTPPAVKVEGIRLGYAKKIWQPERLRQPQHLEVLAQTKPDIILTAAYGQILPSSWLDYPRHGCLNLHASLLPELRGASPIATAILRGDKQTGVTLMKMDLGLDTGDIIATQILPISDTDTTSCLTAKLAQVAKELTVATLLSWLNGEIKTKPQDHDKATKTNLIKKEDGQIDWHCSAQYIARKYRSNDQWPGVYTFVENKRIKLGQIEVAKDVPLQVQESAIGSVTILDKQIFVKCGEGVVRLLSWYAQSGKLVAAKDIYHQLKEVQFDC